jgi:hypothetical protein
LIWFTVAVLVLLAGSGCRRASPVLEAGPTAGHAKVTINGTVRGPERAIPVDGRIVELVNLTTRERTRVATDEDGGYTARVQPGDYRVELTLREGEALVREPGVIHVNRAGNAADGDFVVGTIGSRVARPRSPVYRTDDGLGSPVA